MKEIAPCPWCTDGGRPFPNRSRAPGLSYIVQCNVCFASGPAVKITANCSDRDWAEKAEEARDESVKRWNELRNFNKSKKPKKTKKPEIAFDPFFI